jgi:hypothetical protein
MSAHLIALIGGGFAAGILTALGILYALDNDSDSSPESHALAAPSPEAAPKSGSDVPPSPEPAPTIVEPGPAPAARTCAEIRDAGSYLNDAERSRFQSECEAPTPTFTRVVAPQPATATARPAAATAPPTPTPAPSAAPQAVQTDISGRIEFIGAVWPDDALPVRYCVNPAEMPVRSDGSKLMSDEAFATMVRSAFQTWQDVPESRIAFAYQGICRSDPWNNRDSVNTVGWGWLFGRAIGLADPSGTNGRFLRQNSTGQLFEVDLVIDIRFAQSFADPTDYLQRHLPHIILHEAGHFLGLGHANEPCSVMRPAGVGSGLCWVDVAAASQLYPN